MTIQRKFRSEATGPLGALETYKNLNTEKKALRARAEAIPAELKTQIGEAIQDVYKYMDLVLISPDSEEHQPIRELLVTDQKRDKVHPLETMDDLVKYRLGEENDNKRAYGLVVNIPGTDPEVLAVIYTHWSKQGHDAATLDEQKLPGNVDVILNERVAPLEQTADTGIFYSISSFFPGAGVELIKALRTHLGGDKNVSEMNDPVPALSTLSPFRGFAQWLEDIGENIPHGPELRKAFLKGAAALFLEEKAELTQRFHMTNGAYVGKINIDANTPESVDGIDGAGVMINYVYPAGDALDINQNAFKHGIVTKAKKLKM